MTKLKSFASDNNSGAHPAIMEAVLKANEDHLKSYGDDEISIRTDEVLKEFGFADNEIAELHKAQAV